MIKFKPEGVHGRIGYPTTMEDIRCLNAAGHANFGTWHYRSFLKDLLEHYKELPTREDARMYNIFGTTRYWTSQSPRYNNYFKKRLQGTIFKHSIHYILEYKPGGFTSRHVDPEGRISTITLLEDENLIGGDTIWDRREYVPESLIKENAFSEQQYIEAAENDETFVHAPNIFCPVVIPMKAGVTYAFGEKTYHSVSEVKQGRRLVLVEWLYYDTDKIKLHQTEKAPAE